MRSTHASFVVNRICLPWRDFLAPSGLRGPPRGSKGPQGGMWGWGGVFRFVCRKRVGAFFWSLFCASCMLKSKIFNTVHKRSQKRICLARRHFRTFRWTALIFHDFSWALAVRFWGPKKRPCLWGKETQRFFGLCFARRAC